MNDFYENLKKYDSFVKYFIFVFKIIFNKK